MITCKDTPGTTHHAGCACWEERHASEIAEERAAHARTKAAHASLLDEVERLRERVGMAVEFNTGVEFNGSVVLIAASPHDMPAPGLPWRLFDEDGYALDSAGSWTVAVEAAGYPTADAAFSALARLRAAMEE